MYNGEVCETAYVFEMIDTPSVPLFATSVRTLRMTPNQKLYVKLVAFFISEFEVMKLKLDHQ